MIECTLAEVQDGDVFITPSKDSDYSREWVWECLEDEDGHLVYWWLGNDYADEMRYLGSPDMRVKVIYNTRTGSAL
jgi:hypothetical protein